MTTLQLPREIHASVHQDAVSRVPDFFNAGLSDILTELFQNSRRAGATAIQASTRDGLLTIADDGPGIADPAVLLAFGDSQWDNPLTKSENPAGMGLYSLARREEVSIRSWPANGQPWQVQLQPGNFTGHQPARVTPLSDENKQGTAITFPYERDPEEAMKKASRYFPLPVNFNGEILPSSPFTQGAAHTEEWNGILIAVYPKTRRCPRLNFHGLVINCDHLSYIADLHDYWLADAEVIDCPELRLTLPSRKELVITPFLSRLKEASAAAIYRAMLKHPTPVDVSHSVQQHALSLGITLPDARPLLRPWQPEHADPNAYEPTREHTKIPTDALIMDCTPPVPDQAALARAAAEKALQDRLMTANADLTGYRWYDQLTKVQAISIVADHNGEKTAITSLIRSGLDRQRAPEQRPERITLTLECATAQGPASESYETDLAFVPDEPSEYIDSRTTILTAASTISPQELADELEKAFFEPSDDIDADSYDTQSTDFRTDALRIARGILQTPDEAIMNAVATAVHEHVAYELPWGMNATITIRRDHSVTGSSQIDVTLHQPEELQPPTPQPE